ncbi:hypothetical protein D3C76_1879230 [compost metagenome]
MAVYFQLHIGGNGAEQVLNPLGHLSRMMGRYRIRVTESADPFLIQNVYHVNQKSHIRPGGVLHPD